LKKTLLTAAIAAATLPAFAASTGASDKVKFNGFYNVGISQLSEKDVTYYNEVENEPNVLSNSSVGLRVTVTPDDQSKFVGQMLFEGKSRGYDDFEPQVDWLYYDRKFADNAAFQVGRVRLPFLMDSKNYHVGFSSVAIAPAANVYSVLELTHLDGASVSYSPSIGEFYFNIEAFAGNGELLLDYGQTTLDKAYGVALELNHGDVLYRLSHLEGTQAWSADIPLDIFATKDSLIFNHEDDMAYTSAAVKYDNGEIYAAVEVMQGDAKNDALTDDEVFDITLGYRFDGFMPYVSYSKRETTNTDEMPDSINAQYSAADAAYTFEFIVPGLPFPVQVPSTVGAIAAAEDSNEQVTLVVGSQFELSAASAVKIQVSKLSDFGDTNGSFKENDVLDFDDALLYEVSFQGVF